MRGVAVASLLLVVLVAFSGCSGKSSSSSNGDASGAGGASGSEGFAGASGSGGSSSGSGGAGTTGSSGTSGGSIFKGNGTNHAPVINVFTVNKTAGTFPLAVQFKMNATDQDKDALTFKLNFGDGTTELTGSLPRGNITHTFTTKANFTVKFTATDGKLSVNKTVKVTVTAPAATTSTVTQDESASNLVAANQCQAFHFGDPVEMMFALTPGTGGLHYHATVTGSGLVGIRIGFFDANGSNVGGSTFQQGAFEFNGTVPAAATDGAVEGCGAGPYSATYHAGA